LRHLTFCRILSFIMKMLMDMERGRSEVGGGSRELDQKKTDFVRLYNNTSREEVEEIARLEDVGMLKASNYKLDDINLMLSNPGIYDGVDIPNENELVRLKKILSARKVIEQ
jgi:hypothetical protein